MRRGRRAVATCTYASLLALALGLAGCGGTIEGAADAGSGTDGGGDRTTAVDGATANDAPLGEAGPGVDGTQSDDAGAEAGADAGAEAGADAGVEAGADAGAEAGAGPEAGPEPCVGVAVSPGDDLQALADAHPEDTTFCLAAGSYRFASCQPRRGQRFIGELGTVLSGARVLEGFVTEGAIWKVTGQTQGGQVHGDCQAGFPRCAYPEDLFIDDVPQKHVASQAEVGQGTWFFDYDADTIYLGDDPTGRLVETSVVRVAFAGAATGVVLRGLVIEKYAIPAQMGAIGDQYPAAGWSVEQCELRLNHGTGLNLASNGRAVGNHLHHNGQKGIGAGGTAVLVENNEIDHNNFAGFSAGWEAGGSKFAGTDGLIVRGNFVHHNQGPGLWTDIDNVNTLYEGNTVEDNDDAGIFHEISYAAVVRQNQVRRNGRAFDAWLWGGQIQISTSQNVEIYGNVVDVAADGGNGIVLIQQQRGIGAHGPYATAGCSVHDNTITHLGSGVGASGGVADFDQAAFWAAGNSFNANTYRVPSCASQHFAWDDGWLDFAGFQTHGQEATGSCATP